MIVRDLGLRDYAETLAEMRQFTDTRTAETADELWFVQHPAVFTQGQAGKPEHLLLPGNIPVVQADRGGQVTYHGPGQIVVYCLLDLHRCGYGIRSMVTRLEDAMIATLATYGISARSRREAPGVYVGERKIGALGLRVRRGCSYHGLSLNVDMDLEPFSRINPCGYADLKVTQLRDLAPASNLEQTAFTLQQALLHELLRPALIDAVQG